MIRAINQSGYTSTLVGIINGGYTDGPFVSASFLFPQGITVAGANYDTFYIGDYSAIRIVNLTTNTVSTLAGSTTVGFSDGTGANAYFNIISAIAYHPALNLFFVTDSGNNRIRSVTLAGVVTTIAGSSIQYKQSMNISLFFLSSPPPLPFFFLLSKHKKHKRIRSSWKCKWKWNLCDLQLVCAHQYIFLKFYSNHLLTNLAFSYTRTS